MFRSTVGRSWSVSGCGAWSARSGAAGHTFREQVPGLLERFQRRTARLTSQVTEVVKELCGRAASRPTRFLATPLSYATALRLLRRIPVPTVRVPG